MLMLFAACAGCSSSSKTEPLKAADATSRRNAPDATSRRAPGEPAISIASMPGPDRRGGAAAVDENAACEGCHSDVAAEWRGSMHQRAHEDPAYQRAFAIEPMAFCTRCHAPEAADPSADVPAAISHIGVGCVTCHGAGDSVLAAPLPASAERSDERKSPHAVRRDARFASKDACASCHEFEFPDRAARTAPEFMQSTVREHAASPFADASCASCHMPAMAGAPRRKSHAFASSRDPAALRGALQIAADRTGATTVKITLNALGLGHSFPTGDLFRRVEVLAQAVGPETQLVSERATYLARHFENRHRKLSTTRVLRLDDRIDPRSERVVDLDLGPEAAGFPILYRVTYQRVENSRTVDDPDAPVDSETVLTEGVLPP